jgi:hypothetical protein
MQHGIREFRPRQPLDRQLSSDTLNRILRELESLRITRVVNGTFRKLPGGTEITLAPQRGGGGTPQVTHPFQITSFVDPDSEPESPSYLVTVRPGTLNALLPTNLFDGDELTKFSLSANALKHVVLTGTSDGQQFNSCQLSLETEAPPAQEPVPFGLPQTVKFLVGVVYNSSVFQIISDNMNLAGTQQYVADKETPLQPGELPYTIYFVWG